MAVAILGGIKIIVQLADYPLAFRPSGNSQELAHSPVVLPIQLFYYAIPERRASIVASPGTKR